MFGCSGLTWGRSLSDQNLFCLSKLQGVCRILSLLTRAKSSCKYHEIPKIRMPIHILVPKIHTVAISKERHVSIITAFWSKIPNVKLPFPTQSFYPSRYGCQGNYSGPFKRPRQKAWSGETQRWTETDTLNSALLRATAAAHIQGRSTVNTRHTGLFVCC